MQRKVITSFSRRCWCTALTVILSFVVFYPLGAAAQAQEDTAAELLDVIAAVPGEFPPHYIVDEDGHPIGFAIDVMDEIADLAGLRVTYKVMNSWTDVYAALQDGRVDIIPNLGITLRRQARFTFTTPVETSPISIFVRQSTTDIQSEDDLAGHTVAVVKGNAAVPLLENRPDVETVVYDDARIALFTLLSGQVNALVYPQPVLLRIARSIGVEERIEVVGEPVIEIKRAIAVHKDNTELLARLDETVSRFYKHGRVPANLRKMVRTAATVLDDHSCWLGDGRVASTGFGRYGRLATHFHDQTQPPTG